MDKLAAYEMLLEDHPLWAKEASEPRLISIPNMSDQEVRTTYNALVSMASKKKQRAEPLQPGSLRHRYNGHMYKTHMRDANSFRAGR